MRVLFVATDYPDKGKPTTGFPNYLYRVSLALLQMGHQPIILAPGKREGLRVESGIEIWTIKKLKSRYCEFQSLNYAWNALQIGYALNKKVKEILKKKHIDIVQFTSLYGIAMFYYGKVPAVLRLSSYAKTYFSSFQTHTKNCVKIMSIFEIVSAKRCNIVFAPCKNTALAFGKDCHRNVKVIETPFVNDVEEYDYQFFDKYLRGKKYVLFFGTLYAEKGILIIAEILEKFLNNNPDYYFVFIGDILKINDKSAACILKEKAGKYSNRIVISNAISHKKLYPVIMRADFVVLPSLMDNMPNACIEAMYFEKIVIGTKGASFEQLITHEKNGLLCRIGDSNDLLEKMQMAVSMSKEKKLSMGKLAKKRIDRLKPEYTTKKLLKLYEYVMKAEK